MSTLPLKQTKKLTTKKTLGPFSRELIDLLHNLSNETRTTSITKLENIIIITRTCQTSWHRLPDLCVSSVWST